MREYFVLLTFYDDLTKAKNIIDTKSSEGLLPPDIDIEFLRKMLESEDCLICNAKLNNEGRNNINELIKRVNISSKSSNVLSSIKHDIDRLIEKTKNYESYKNEFEVEYKRIANEYEYNQQLNNSIHKILSTYSNKEHIKNAFNERQEHIKLEIGRASCRERV